MRELHYRVVSSAGYDMLRSITLGQDVEWANDPAILEFCRYAEPITALGDLELLSMQELENFKKDMERKKNS